jgi:hypothetical protein
MSETGPESSPGDYSYDLAHETDAAGHASEPRRDGTREPVQGATDGDQAGDQAGAQAGDQGGDYSYDLAHDVPPAGS